jgi:hypothetical protein
MKKTLASILFSVVLLVFMGCPEGLDGLLGDGDIVEVVSNPLNLLQFDSSYNDSGTRAEADMFFPSVDEFGATRFILYSSATKDGIYSEFESSGERVDTDPATSDSGPTVGFGIAVPSGGAWFKLLIEGGDFDGQFSNRVFAPYCTGAAYCEGWGLDESMANTGTMAPNAGYGLVASFTIKDTEGDILEDVLDYQWYRVDPNNWEDEEAIDGATSLEYITTDDDIGHQLLIRATGKDGFAGGLVQGYSSGGVVK